MSHNIKQEFKLLFFSFSKLYRLILCTKHPKKIKLIFYWISIVLWKNIYHNNAVTIDKTPQHQEIKNTLHILETTYTRWRQTDIFPVSVVESIFDRIAETLKEICGELKRWLQPGLNSCRWINIGLTFSALWHD